MNNDKPKRDDKPLPSQGPLKNEPTPEQAHEQKKRQSERGGDDVSLPGQRPPADS